MLLQGSKEPSVQPGALNSVVAINQQQLELMNHMRADHQRQISFHAEVQNQITGSLQRSIYDNSRAADSLNSQVSFLRGATLALVDSRGGRQPVFASDGNVVQGLRAFQEPSVPPPLSPSPAQRRLSANSAFFEFPPPAASSQRSPGSPFDPISVASPAPSVSTSPSAAAACQGNQVDAETLGRFFAAQNPDVLQQLLQIVYSHAKPAPPK